MPRRLNRVLLAGFLAAVLVGVSVAPNKEQDGI